MDLTHCAREIYKNRAIENMLEKNEEPLEEEPHDPDATNPAYRIQVTLSPKMLDRRDSRPGDEKSALWGPHDPKKDTLQIEGNISRQKRYCFFESHKHEKHKKDKVRLLAD